MSSPCLQKRTRNEFEVPKPLQTIKNFLSTVVSPKSHKSNKITVNTDEPVLKKRKIESESYPSFITSSPKPVCKFTKITKYKKKLKKKFIKYKIKVKPIKASLTNCPEITKKMNKNK